jgi:pilus assembly protein FimV
VAQHTGRQYDDDLTVGVGEYNESFSTDYVDLFEPLGDDDAPIAKLKTIILSIDWEITDEILHQLNEELQDLKDVWAGNRINLIYVQALEKIGRYISIEKANSHPNAIKLLLSFYYNLEKIVSSSSMSEEEKKQLLLQDVKKFDQFKAQIAPAKEQKGPAARPVASEPRPAASVEDALYPTLGEQKNVLTNLKAIVLGIDWEISEQALVRLSEEINNLEKIFSESRAKLIFLQGLGALGSYIRSAKSRAHPEAFKLFRSFYEGLERIYTELLSKDQEKVILLAEVKKFNAFKAVIAATSSEAVPVAAAADTEKETAEEEGGVITPAFSDMPDDVHGFREESEARSDIDKRVASFFGEQEEAIQFVDEAEQAAESAPGGLEVDSRLDSLFGDEEEDAPTAEASDIALSGVDVETEADDDSDERALPLQGGRLAPALAENSGRNQYMEELSSAESPLEDSSGAALVIPGVDVETEADDESEEPVLPSDHLGVAPALVFTDEVYGFREAEFVGELDEGESDLEDRLDSFFGAEIEESLQGRTPPAGDEAFHDSPSAVAPSTGLSLKESQERGSGLFADEAQSGPALFSESFALEREEDEGDATLADRIFDEAEVEMPAAVESERQEVVFQPVGDDVEVDELPAERGWAATDSETTLEKEDLAGLRQSVALILEQRYDSALPLFFAEINSLRKERPAEYVRNAFLQLLETVGRYIDTYRGETDLDSLTLLQSLDNNIERMSQRKTGRDDDEREQLLYEETGKVLLWQQGLISSLLAKQGRGEGSEQ